MRPWRWGLFWSVAVALVVAYAVAVPRLFAAPDYVAQGPLSYTEPALEPEATLAPGGPTAAEVAERERDELGYCGDDPEFKIVGGAVDGEPYFAVYDVPAGEICWLTIRSGVTGRDLDVDGDAATDVVRVAKDGGAWPWIGPVNTTAEVWLGLAAVVAGLVTGGFLTRRDLIPRLIRGESGLTWVYVGFLGGAALALVLASIDVFDWPDRLGYTAMSLVDAAWLWGFGAGTLLLSPSLIPDYRPATSRRIRLPQLRPPRWLRLRLGGRRRRQAQPVPASPAAVVPRFRVTPTSELPHFGAVGGMHTVKAQLEDTLGLLLAFAGEAEAYRITFNGILLHGPPGTGKTYLAKSVAGEFGLSFVHVTASDLVSKYVGETARNVEAAFQTAAANVPCLLFFDEFDAIASRRDDDANAEDRRAVAQLLTSLERHRALPDLIVMAATNDLERLDAAAVRPGRFDRHIRVDLPDAEGREGILRACLAGRPAKLTDLSQVVRRTEGCSAATLAAVVEQAAMAAFREATTSGRQVAVTVPHLLGALESRGGNDRPTVEQWTWERLILPAEVKAELRQVQSLVEDPERARSYGVRPLSGMLLAGPPGTGKTTIARVLAAQAQCSFYPVTVADLTSKWVGESEDTIARLFSRARENAPSIVFLDEVDAVAGRRGGSSSGFEQRLINQLLAEMDGMSGRSQVFVLAATNRPDTLDPALTRGGRLSRTLWIPLPDRAGRLALLQLHARHMPLARDVDLAQLAHATEDWSGADLEALCQQAAVVAMTRAAGDESRPGRRTRREVTREDFGAAVQTMQRARHSAASASMTPRDHLFAPPGVGGS